MCILETRKPDRPCRISEKKLFSHKKCVTRPYPLKQLNTSCTTISSVNNWAGYTVCAWMYKKMCELEWQKLHKGSIL